MCLHLDDEKRESILLSLFSSGDREKRGGIIQNKLLGNTDAGMHTFVERYDFFSGVEREKKKNVVCGRAGNFNCLVHALYEDENGEQFPPPMAADSRMQPLWI